MGLFCPAACRGFRTIRHGVLALVLASLISLEIPDVSVVRAQDVPALYGEAQGGSGNAGWVSPADKSLHVRVSRSSRPCSRPTDLGGSHSWLRAFT